MKNDRQFINLNLVYFLNNASASQHRILKIRIEEFLFIIQQ
jgi:hypothetical protein